MAALMITLAVLTAGCATAGDAGSSTPGKQLSGSATVFAAASLTESFTELGRRFEDQNPHTRIVFNFGPSSGLATQVAEQGGADLFASADRTSMEKVVDGGLTEGDSEVLVRNVLQIIVSPGNPRGIRTLADLAKPGLKVVLAAPQVPVGRYARQALGTAGVTVTPVSEAVDTKGVVGPVSLGEADAGIVYATDVKAAGDRAEGVAIPDDLNVTAEYPIALIKGGTNPQVAKAFLDLALSAGGRQVLTEHGFLAP
jgi:molybdate transport system substrate-binding protein